MNYDGKRVVVMGLGRFGGGLGVTRWLLDQGAIVVLTDLASEEDYSEQLQMLGSHSNLILAFGEHSMVEFERADVVVANPAIPTPWSNVFLKAAWDAGAKVTTEICLVVEQLDRMQVIGVTGTAGKSTTAAMIHAAVCGSGLRCHLGGNIGGSLLDEIQSIKSEDIVVLELSSAMLWWLGSEHGIGWSPHVAVLTNIEPNHIDWHGSQQAYEACKQAIFTNQMQGDISFTQDPNATFDGLRVLGQHNQRNAAIALSAAVAIGAQEKLAHASICEFEGLPHRLQYVCDGWYNDSKSTTPMATKLAVEAFGDPSRIHLVVGGYDKQVDLSLLAAQSTQVACMYTMGATGDKIAQLAHGNVQSCETLEESVSMARNTMHTGDILLLSPGCASWDQFENYEQRGDLFCSLAPRRVCDGSDH